MSVADLLLGWAELEEHYEAYALAEAYAEGRVDEVFASNGTVARKLQAASRRYRFSLLGVPVRSRVDRCKINTIKADNDAATEAIGTVWDANDMDVWYPELISKTFIFGDAYVMAWPLAEAGDEEDLDSASPADEELIQAGVELTVHDPKHCRVIYDPENERRKAFAIRRWQITQAAEGDGPSSVVWRVDVWYPGSVEHWVSLENAQLDQEGGWAEYAEDDPGGGEVVAPVEPNPFGEIPFFHHRTGLPYGRPVHEDGYGAQNAVTKMLCTQLDTSDSQGWPQRYRLLDPDAELDQNNDTPEFLDDEFAEVFSAAGVQATGGSSSSLRQGPGTMQTFPGTKEVGQFEAALPALFLEPAVTYIRLMSVLTGTPAWHFWPEDSALGAAPSGESRRREEAPLVASIQRLQTLQRGALREEWLFVLRTLGIKAKELDIQWEPVDQATSLEDWQVIGLKQQYGVPQEQTLTEAGYTTEQAEEWAAEAERKQEEMMAQMADLAASDANGGAGKSTPSGPPKQPEPASNRSPR